MKPLNLIATTYTDVDDKVGLIGLAAPAVSNTPPSYNNVRMKKLGNCSANYVLSFADRLTAEGVASGSSVLPQTVEYKSWHLAGPGLTVYDAGRDEVYRLKETVKGEGIAMGLDWESHFFQHVSSCKTGLNLGVNFIGKHDQVPLGLRDIIRGEKYALPVTEDAEGRWMVTIEYTGVLYGDIKKRRDADADGAVVTHQDPGQVVGLPVGLSQLPHQDDAFSAQSSHSASQAVQQFNPYPYTDAIDDMPQPRPGSPSIDGDSQRWLNSAYGQVDHSSGEVFPPPSHNMSGFNDPSQAGPQLSSDFVYPPPNINTFSQPSKYEAPIQPGPWQSSLYDTSSHNSVAYNEQG